MRTRFAMVALLCCALLLAACGDEGGSDSEGGNAAPAEEENVVEVGLMEYSFDMVEEAEAGTITFDATNQGDLPHEIAFGQIEGDRTMDDVMKALEGGRPPQWFKDIAGVPVLSPGVSASMTRDLDEGQYIFLCFLPTPEGGPHAEEGMIRLFNLTGTSDAEAPTPDLTITATEDGFDVPDISAGTHTIELVNDGSKPHEFAFLSYEEGMTEKDIGKWFQSGYETDAPALFPGGMHSIKPGTSVIVEMTFESGRTYTLEDFEAKFTNEIEVE